MTREINLARPVTRSVVVRRRAGYVVTRERIVCGALITWGLTRRQRLLVREGFDVDQHCDRPAGDGTGHAGLGRCRRHGGTTRRVERAWKMAVEVADQLNVSPWDALLLEVRRAAGRCAWLDDRLRVAVRDDETRLAAERVLDDGDDPQVTPGGLQAGVRALLRESRNERRHLAVVAKAAIDAGVAERLVRQVELEGQLVAAAVVAGLDALGLDVEDRQRALAAAHSKLAELED